MHLLVVHEDDYNLYTVNMLSKIQNYKTVIHVQFVETHLTRIGTISDGFFFRSYNITKLQPLLNVM